MSRTEYLKALFSESTVGAKVSSELLLLKKIILLCHQGQLKVNDQYPDKKFTLADYLLDERRMMLDLSLLDEYHHKKLKNLIQRSHQVDLISRFSASYKVSEEQGYPEEKALGFWQQLLNSSWFSDQYYSCYLLTQSKSEANIPYALSRIDLCFSKNAILVDLVPQSRNPNAKDLMVAREYSDDGYLQNVKRVILTNDIISALAKEELADLDLTNSLSEAHPHSIDVISPEVREKLIFEHRYNRQYEKNSSFFWRIIKLLIKWWSDLISSPVSEPIKHDYKFFCHEKGLVLSHCSKTGKVLAYEKRLPIDSVGLSGGGARIFSYLGVIDVLEQYGIKPKKYAGSSAGAIMASLLFIGYQSSELKEKFQWITDNLLLNYKIDFSGLSSTDKIKDALEFFILHRVQDEIKKHSKWFASKEAQSFIAKNVNRHITFGTVTKLKSMCPDLNFAEELIVTVTNKTLRRTELFSSSTTPDMEIAEAVKISASMPVIYKPTTLGKHSYTDGGVLNNLPLSYFSNNEQQFISHELSGSLSVLALQFSTGVEEAVVYSNKPVYREHWLLNSLYSFLIGISDPVSAWVGDRLILRHYSAQTILIDVKDIKATKFDIDLKTRDELIQSGQMAAKEYMSQRYRKDGDNYINDEYLSTSFENLEALLIYCGIKKKWQVLDCVISEIKTSDYVNDEYRLKLLRVADALQMIRQQEKIKPHAYQNKWRKLLPVLNGLNRMKVGFRQEEKDKSALYCTLFPVLSQKWLGLLSSEPFNNSNSHLKMLEAHRVRLNVVDQVLVFNSLVDTMEDSSNPSHLFYYILKTLLVYGRNEEAFDDIKFDALKFTKVFSALKKKHYLNVRALVDNWSFDLAKCRDLLHNLSEGNFNQFYENLGEFYRVEYDLKNLQEDEQNINSLAIVL